MLNWTCGSVRKSYRIPQLLVVLALVMVLIADLALCGPIRNDLQRVKPAAFYNDCSKRYLRIKGRTEVAADDDEKYKFYMVTVNNSHGFLLFDPKTSMFLCWKKSRKNVQSKLTPRRNPKDLSMCIFEELPVDGAYTKYVSTKYKNQVMGFRSNGLQRIGKKSSMKWKCQPESFIQDKKQFNESASDSYAEFCKRMRRIKHHKLPDEIRSLCGLSRTSQQRKRRLERVL